MDLAFFLTLVLLFAPSPSAPSPSAARIFTDVTDAEHALTEVPGYPAAPAVVLFKRAELRLRDSWTGTPSILDVHVRVKILTEGGKAFGQIAIGHGASLQLERFAGRTVLPDGRAVALAEDAIFHQSGSRVRQRLVTRAAFPAVEVGAILDYRYRLRWSSFFLEPWTFDDRIPTVLSELVYHQPHGMTVEQSLHGKASFQTQSDSTSRGTVVRIWAENLPPVLEEPYGFPYSDLTHHVTLVPERETRPDGSVVDLLDSWKTVCGHLEEREYDPSRRRARQVKKKASQLLRTVGKGKGEKIKTLHAIKTLHVFVRDQIETSDNGIRTASESLDAVLDAGRGTYAEKALLLQALLKAAKVPSRLVWAVDWREGFADLEVVNPGWFEKTLVLVDSVDQEDGRLFLDPGEPVAAGALPPTVEGTDALIVDSEHPRVIRLPSAPAASSLRGAKLELSVDEEGGVLGRGQLTLTGHHAWFHVEAVDATWRQWLTEHFEGFEILEVDVSSSVDEQRIDLAWTLALAEELVLGDEVSLPLSRPLGPLRQRYTIPPEQRRTAVHVSFADRDELELTVTWPEGWRVDIVPDNVDSASAHGSARAVSEVDPDGRRLVYRRFVEIPSTRYDPGEPYSGLRELYGLMERHDAQSLVLFRDD